MKNKNSNVCNRIGSILLRKARLSNVQTEIKLLYLNQPQISFLLKFLPFSALKFKERPPNAFLIGF